MSFRKFAVFFCLILSLAAASTTGWSQVCGANTTDLVAPGGNGTVGSVTVSNTAGTYTTTGPWLLDDVKLDIENALANFPYSGMSGKPAPNQFSYQHTFSPAASTYTFTIPLDNVQVSSGGQIILTTGETIYIAAYADLEESGGTTLAWGAGTSFVSAPGDTLPQYFTYKIQSCGSTTIQPGEYETYTQGAFSLPARSSCPNSGSTPRSILVSNFSTSFPSTSCLEVGSGAPNQPTLNYTVTLNSACAVESLLPTGGTPGALNQNATDPTSTSGGTLTGQTVALTLNVIFDLGNHASDNLPDFGALVVVDSSSPCKGMTVNQVLAAANTILGGGTYTGLDASAVNGCADNINQNFDNGTSVGTFLGLP